MSANFWSDEDLIDFRTANARAQISALEWMRGRKWTPVGTSPEEWGDILSKITDGWQAILDLDNLELEEKFGPEFESDCLRRFYEGMDLYRDWYLAFWD